MQNTSPVSPMLQQTIDRQKAGVSAAVQQPKPNLTQKPEIIESVQKPAKSKIGKYLAIGAVCLVAATGAALIINSLIRKGNLLGAKDALKYAEKAQAQADEAQKYAENIRSEAGKLYTEITELFNNGGMKDGNKVANITTLKGGTELMEELASDGSTVLRKSTFIDKVLSDIEIPQEKGCNKFIFTVTKGELLIFNEGYEKLADGSEKIAKELIFEDGKLDIFKEGFESFANGSEKIAKELNFIDRELSSFKEGIEKSADGRQKIAKRLSPIGGKLDIFQEGFERFEDESQKVAKELCFKDGKLSIFKEGIERFADKNVIFAKELKFEDKKPFYNIGVFLKSLFNKSK